METQDNHQRIVDKLKQGMKFGLFEDGNKCYFQNGEKVSYTDLWRALREVHELENGTSHKTIPELCPDTFVGIFPYKFSKHNWKKKQAEKQ